MKVTRTVEERDWLIVWLPAPEALKLAQQIRYWVTSDKKNTENNQ